MKPTGRTHAVVLAALAFAFFLRVLGQAVVAVADVPFLPPMAEWYSGIVPYPVLLPVQILILGMQAAISRDLWRGSGLLAVPRPRVGPALCWFAGVYFAIMAIRYVVTMAAHPERRWLTGTIPIFFHWVLAAYLYVLARYHIETREPRHGDAGSAARAGPPG